MLCLAATACAGGVSAQTGPGPVPTTAAGSPASTAPPTTLRPRAYDNTNARLACGLLQRSEIEFFFTAPAGEPKTVDPFCQWSVGSDAWLSLEIRPGTDVGTFRKDWGAAPVAEAAVGTGGYFANNKALVFGAGNDTYIVGWQKSGTWDDKFRPQQVALAKIVLARLATATPVPPAEVRAETIDVKRALTPEEPLRLWVGGDSLAGGPSWAIGDLLDKTGLVRSQREFHVGTGLIRPDFLDWRTHLEASMDAYRPEAVLLMFGGNDAQNIVVDGRAVTPDDPRWAEAYRQRVADVLDVTAVDGRAVVWIGVPPMKDAKLNAPMATINQIAAAEVAKRPNTIFFDTWGMFSAAGRPGAYVDALPDKGKNVVMRLDGIHFNTDGSLYLARAMLPKLKELVPNLPV